MGRVGRPDRAVVRRLLSASVLPWVLLGSMGCAGGGPDPDMADLFMVAPPVPVDDSVVAALTRRVPMEERERFGERIGRIPLAMLRSPGGPVPGNAAEGSAVTTVSGEWIADGWSPIPGEVLETPYWTSIFRRLGAQGGGRAFVATNLIYRIYVHQVHGEPVDSLGVPPPSWRQARRPSFGEFPPERASEWSAYLDSLTVLYALAVVADSVLLVTHGPFGGSAEWGGGVGRLDVYVGRRKRMSDLKAPGALVAYTRRSVFFLAPSDSAGASTLVEYSWRDPIP